MQPLKNIDIFHNPLAMLQWQVDLGVDSCVEDLPQRVEAQSAAAPALTRETPAHAASPAVSSAAAKPTAPSLNAAIEEARTLADSATTLAELETAIRGFTGCALKKTASHTVFAQGNAQSRLMFVGEAPGDDEDRKGLPFVGAGGKLLDLMVSFIGLKRETDFYITHALFWRPPGNRLPTTDELEICRPFVEKHIALANPKILVLVGGTVTKTLLNDSRGVTRLRGQKFTYKNDYMNAEIPVHVIYQPNHLLRQPLAKKQAWADLLALKAALQSA